MGIACPLEPLFTFDYREPVSADLIENELVHVFGGTYDGPIAPDPAEVVEHGIHDASTRSCQRSPRHPRRPTRSGSAATSPHRGRLILALAVARRMIPKSGNRFSDQIMRKRRYTSNTLRSVLWMRSLPLLPTI